MSFVRARSAGATEAFALVEELQDRFRRRLEAAAGNREESGFDPVTWLRDEGRHGGGVRLVARGGAFHRASINVSQVHYDDLPHKKLASANALSTIVHPENPRAPSVHIHVSWTESKDGAGYWRLMADLNPAVPDASDTAAFAGALRAAAPEHYAAAAAQGDRYFHIPALARHRGATHFYLEQFTSGDRAADLKLARRFAEAATDSYATILGDALASRGDITAAERARQREYFTLYLFQVLTLDRGTTSGLLVHDQNDVGILGSLPGRVDRDLLASWQFTVPRPQGALVAGLVDAIAEDGAIDDGAKKRLAQVVREHYRAHPEALALQASGDFRPPTVANHR